MAEPYARLPRRLQTPSAALADRLGFGEQFTEGRTARQWLAHMYEKWSAGLDFAVPSFDEFWAARASAAADRDGPDAAGRLPGRPAGAPTGHAQRAHRDLLGDHRRLRLRRLRGPSRRGTSRTSGWAAPRAARYPLHLLANQPATRLHSQLDGGATSQESKVQGREPIRMHPADAAARGLADGDVVRVFNDRGACLAGLVVDDRLRREVVQLSTGAWYDPEDPADPDAMCVHGNPNVLTADVGTSSLARAAPARTCWWRSSGSPAALPPVRAHEPPTIVEPMTDTIEVRELGRTLHFTFDDALRYAGPAHRPASRWRSRRCSAPSRVLSPDGPPERRAVTVRTAFRGPGARDCFEAVDPRRDRRPLRRRPLVAASRSWSIARGLRVRGEHRRPPGDACCCGRASSPTSSSTSPARTDAHAEATITVSPT